MPKPEGRNYALERLKDVLNRPRERLEIEDERDQEKDQGVERDRDIDRGPTHGM
jgi:hypothetical protein